MAAPELRLSVGLDLEFFRGQMRKIVNIVQSEFTAQLNVKINRRVLDSELNYVSRMFARRDFRLQVNDTTIKVARLNAQKLKNTLDSIAGTKYAINVQGVPSGGFAQGPTGAAGLFEYMRTQGLSGGGGATAVGRTARVQKALEDLTVKQLQSLARQEGIAGVSKLRKTPLIERMMTGLSQLAMERILGDAKMMLQSPFPYVATTGVSGRTLGARVSGQMPMGSPLPMLPGAGQTAAFSMGTLPSKLRQPSMPSAGMMGPSSQLGRGYFASKRLAAALRDSDPMLRQSRVPLAGAIEELGGQFANATKQVLLYGTAYKGLAFLMNMPREIFEATKALQLFENQMRAITGSAAEADRAFSFVDELSERFALPLQSARQGFAQLYASMSPAGIPAQDIETLFTGMANAAATFGFSSAEMDRMTLAFSQMASKGKIMTEEVTRQLGDVLPGALALMARAAQLEIADFIDAMQKGQLSGEAMKAVMFNIGIIMKQEFGEGAKNAAALLRGAMNEMGNAVTRMYEAFRPLVENLAAKAIPAITNAIKSATTGVKAFVAEVTGSEKPMEALDGIAQAVFDTLKSLNETLKALGVIAREIGPALGAIAQSLLFVVEQVARFINTKFGGFLAGLTAQALLLTAALSTLAKTGIALALAGVINLIRNVKLLKAQKIALIAITSNLKLGLIALGSVVVLGAIKALADALRGPEERLRAMQQRLAAARKGFDDLARAGNVEELSRQLTQARQEEATAERALLQAQRMSKRTVAETGTMEPTSVSTESAEFRLQEAQQRRIDLEKSLRNAERVAAPALPDTELREVVLQGVDDGTAGRTKELRDYLDQRVSLIRLLGQIEQNRIALTQNYSNQEVAIFQAIEARRTEHAANERQYLEDQRDAVNYSEETRGLYLDSIRERYEAQKEIIEQQAQESIEGPLFTLERQLIDQNTELAISLDALKQGRTELSDLERVGLELTKLENAFKTAGLKLTDEQTKAVRAQALAQQELNDAKREQNRLNDLFLRERRARTFLTDDLLRLEIEEQYRNNPLTAEKFEEVFLDEKRVREIERASERIKNIAQGIGDAFGQAFKDIITGTSSVQESLAQMFRSIADSFANMVSEMISQWARGQVIGLFTKLLPGLAPMADAGLAPRMDLVGKYADSAIPVGEFATGGIVRGPTLGLVGEGRYNEAIVPLPDGRSIPVDLGGAASGSSAPINTNIVVNVKNGQAESQVSGNQGNQLARELEGAVRQVILKETRPGGLIPSSR